MPLGNEEFVNPQPPPNYRPQTSRDDSNSQPLTNADFRKLLMTPAASTHRLDASIRGSNISSATPSSSSQKISKQKANHDIVEKRKLKKLYYASLMKEIKEREEELSKKYRDRAKERREASNNNKTSNEYELFNTTAMYRAVGPDLNDQAETRRRLIEESKYLGGDLEHTHLVKGLDYALLQKVRAELDQKEALEAHKQANNQTIEDLKEADDEEDEEQIKNIKKLQMKLEALKTELKEEKQKEEAEDASKLTVKTKIAKNICRVLFKPPPPKFNELFLPRRMAYVMDLEDEETDIPVTLMRSKAECPTQELSTSTNTNEIVINKLIQILSYLRQDGKKDLKNKKKQKVKTDEIQMPIRKDPNADLGIYDDVDDYIPGSKNKKEETTKSEFALPLLPKRSYFSENKEDKKEISAEAGPSKESATAFIRNINEKYSNAANGLKSTTTKSDEKKATTSGMSVKFDSDSYSECYPGTTAEDDVYCDSDDECDFDEGKDNGPNKQTLFQFESQKTKRGTQQLDAKQGKQKLNKEWDQISKLIEKRKAGEYSSSELKKIKY